MKRYVLVILIVLLFSMTSVVSAFSGDVLKVTSAFSIAPGTGSSFIGKVQTDPNGRVVIVGTVNRSTTVNIALVRMLPDGNMDSTFGSGGEVVTNVVTAYKWNSVSNFTFDSDGRILVVGLLGTTQAFLLRVMPDGSTDTTFGNNGVVVVTMAQSSQTFNSVAVQSDGKILVTATNHLRRYETNGTLDATFGVNGIILLDAYAPMNSLFILPDGKLLIQANTSQLIRLNPDTTLDTSFGNAGYAPLLPPCCRNLGAVLTHTILNGSKLVTAGALTSYDMQDGFFVAQHNLDGTPDLNFGTGGFTMLTSFNGEIKRRGFIADLNPGPDSTLLVTMKWFINDIGETFRGIFRITALGAVDTTFNGDGFAPIPPFDNYGISGAAALADGSILVAGAVGSSHYLPWLMVQIEGGESTPPPFPLVPADFAPALVGEGQVQLTWTDPQPGLTEGYILRRRNKVWATVSKITNRLPATTTAFLDSPNPPCGVAYDYQIGVINPSGVALSNWVPVEMSPCLLPPPPQITAVTSINSDQVRINFYFDNDTYKPGANFRYEYRLTGATDWSQPEWPRLDTTQPRQSHNLEVINLICGKQYDFRLIAYNQYGSSQPSEPHTGTPLACMSAADTPTPVTIMHKNPWQFDINWTDKGNNETSYHLRYRKPPTGEWHAVRLAANTTTYPVDWPCNAPFLVQVYALNNSGISPKAEFRGRTLDCTAPLPPSNLAEYNSYFQWQGSAGANSYLLQRSITGVNTWQTVKTIKAPVTGFIYEEHFCGRLLYYRVVAKNAYGLSEPSNQEVNFVKNCMFTLNNDTLEQNTDGIPQLPDRWKGNQLEPDDLLLCDGTNCAFTFTSGTPDNLTDGLWQTIMADQQPGLKQVLAGDRMIFYVRAKTNNLSALSPDHKAACLTVTYKTPSGIYQSPCVAFKLNSRQFYLMQLSIPGANNIKSLQVFVRFQSPTGTMTVDDFGVTVIRQSTGRVLELHKVSRWPSQRKPK